MTTVTESYPLPMRPDERCYPDALLTPLCPWPQRRCCASQLRPVKNEDRGDLRELDWGPVCHLATGCSQPSPPSLSPPSSLSSLSGQWKYGAGQEAVAMMLSLILRWWIVPLPFTWIYIYILTDTVKDPRSLQRPQKVPQRVNVETMNEAVGDFICQIEMLVLVLMFYSVCFS